MRAVTFQDVGRVAVESVPEPRLVDEGDALVRVDVAGLCGSDLHPYEGRETGLDRGTIMGHEFVGVVEAVGPAVGRVAVGDRVVAPFTTSCGLCFYCGAGLTARCARGQLFGWVEGGRGLHGAQAEFVRVPLADGTLVPVPEAVDDDAVALLAGDILSTALFGVSMAGIQAGEVAAVVGCGPVGLLGIRAALEKGAVTVIALDPVASRRRAAERWGAVAVEVDPENPAAAVQRVRDLTAGRGADGVVEAVGTPQATRLAADVLRHGGRLAAIGVHTEPRLALSPVELYDRNLTYAAGRCSARAFMPRALKLAERDTALLSTLITHRLPLTEAPDAYRRFAAREPGMHKVVFHHDRTVAKAPE